MPCYLIMIFNEKRVLIHCHSFKGSWIDAIENAKKSCLFHSGDDWEISEVKAG